MFHAALNVLVTLTDSMLLLQSALNKQVLYINTLHQGGKEVNPPTTSIPHAVSSLPLPPLLFGTPETEWKA